MASEEARAGRAQPEAELLASGSGAPPVNLHITNVYNSSSSEEVTLGPTDTIGDLKRMLEGVFANRPAPHQQRLIFRGKQCEEGQQIGHILRGMDLSVRQTFHLVVTQPTEGSSQPTPAFAQPSRLGAGRTAPFTESPRPTDASVSNTRAVGAGGSRASNSALPGEESAQLTASIPKPERVALSSEQVRQLQWQYQQALREQQQALQQQHQRYRYLARQSVALTNHNGRAPSSDPPLGQPHQRMYRWHEADPSEVATAAATRALGGNMPGPAAGGAVRDITGGPAGIVPAAGFPEEDGRPVRQNLADPPLVAGPARVNRGRLLLQLFAVVFVFGSDAEEWQLFVLGLGAGVVFLYRTGALEILLGEDEEGRGMEANTVTGGYCKLRRPREAVVAAAAEAARQRRRGAGSERGGGVRTGRQRRRRRWYTARGWGGKRLGVFHLLVGFPRT